jgi:hypothetical protein
MIKNFEAVVSSIVETIVPVANIQFFEGSMFVTCSVPEAIQIESKLADASITTIISRIGSDVTAYDFV